MKYVINAIPPSNNKFKGRENAWEYRNLKKEWETLVFYSCRPLPAQPLSDVIVKISYFFPNRQRHDPDNYSGVFILDGLTKSGIIKDDSFACITLYLDGKYDKENPRTEIEIYSRKEDVK